MVDPGPPRCPTLVNSGSRELCCLDAGDKSSSLESYRRVQMRSIKELEAVNSALELILNSGLGLKSKTQLDLRETHTWIGTQLNRAKYQRNQKINEGLEERRAQLRQKLLSRGLDPAGHPQLQD